MRSKVTFPVTPVFAVSTDPAGADTTVLDELGVETMSGTEAGIAAALDPTTLGSRALFPDVHPTRVRERATAPPTATAFINVVTWSRRS